MGAHAQPLCETRPTATASLRGERRVSGYSSLASARCLARESGAELAPASNAGALGQTVVAHQVGDSQTFQMEGVVVAQQRQRGLMVEVPPLPLHLLLLAR